MLLSGLGLVRMVKNCYRGLENAARGRRRLIGLSGFVYATLSLNRLTHCQQTIRT